MINKAIEALLPELRRSYPDSYVALSEGSVVCSDEDEARLISKCKANGIKSPLTFYVHSQENFDAYEENLPRKVRIRPYERITIVDLLPQ